MRLTQISIALVFGLLAGLSGCASGPTTRVDRDPAADLNAYRTFGFFEPQEPGATGYTTITTARLKAATRSRLEQLGYRYDDKAPDIRVNFTVTVVDRQELHATPAAGRPLYRGWAGHGDINTVNYRRGTLSIDIVDVARNALIWRGVAEGRLNPRNARDPGATVTRAVEEILAEFPRDAA